MATVTKENIGLLHEKLTVKLEKTDYLPSFEKALKEYSKKANIPGFRKGMVPAGLIKKMYGTSLFSDEVLKTVDKELSGYLQNMDIFGQPLPLDTDLKQIDVNNPADYSFEFEVGMRPDFKLADLGEAAITRYVVTVTDEMVNNEVDRLQNRYGNMKDEETVTTEDNVLNVTFTEANADGSESEGGIIKDNSILVKYFAEAFRKNWIGKKAGDAETVQLNTAFDGKEREWIIGDLGLDKEDPTAAEKYFTIAITKVGLLEKRELNEEFFTQLYPTQEVKTEEEFRNKVKEEIQKHWNGQATNQIYDQVFHQLVDHTDIQFPEGFLKKLIKTQENNAPNPQAARTDEEVEKEFPTFLSGLKWQLITDKIVHDNDIQVTPDEVRNSFKQQLFSYMGGANLSDDQPWLADYVEKMMKDKKAVEDTYTRIQSQKIFEWAGTQVKPADKDISAEEFTKMAEAHQHHH